MATIMHLSDLHLGNDVIFRGLLRRRSWWRGVSKQVTKGLATAIRNINPDVLVISGDFVNKPNTAAFHVAAEYVKALCQEAGFDMKERLLLAPGNHDVSFVPRKHDNDLKRLRLYRQFLRDVFQESSTESRKARYIYLYPSQKLLFACLDSTLKNHAPLAEGEIGQSQREWIKRKLATLAAMMKQEFAAYTKIAVLHHHCVPIAGAAAGGERFMQLLDAGDLLKLLEECEFNLVLHGHRHVPHVHPRVCSDSGVLTIVGAGTTTCPYIEDQGGYGNNFNRIDIFPQKNELSVQRFTANQIGEYVPQGAQTYPLLRIPTPIGYSTTLVKKVTRLSRSGFAEVTVIKRGLRVEKPGERMYAFPIRIGTSVPNAVLKDLSLKTERMRLVRVSSANTLIEAEVIFDPPLEYGAPAVDVVYSYTADGAMAMSGPQFRTMYNTETKVPEEGASVVVSHPMDDLEIEITFPPGFRVEPRVKIEYLGGEIPASRLQHALHHDPYTGVYVLTVANPPLQHRIGLTWLLPDVWEPPAQQM